MNPHTTSQAFFEAKYRSDADPWNFSRDPYENWRYGITMEALGGRRFRRAFEPGCSVGVLTARLAGVCGVVGALDISTTAVNAAKRTCRNLANVHISRGTLPADIPEGTFDLIVFSEIGYYFELAMLPEVAASLVRTLEPGGLFLAVHWLGVSSDHRMSGDQVHDIIHRQPGLVLAESQRHPSRDHAGFRLDSWVAHA